MQKPLNSELNERSGCDHRKAREYNLNFTQTTRFVVTLKP